MRVLFPFKKVVIGITGGVAAYKTCELVRLLVRATIEVKVVMTEHAKNFIHPNTLAALSENIVYDDLFSDTMLHITLAKWADSIIIAPATANTISQLSKGAAHDLLTTVCLATEAPKIIVPAMNKVMWEHPATQNNIHTLSQYGYHIIAPTFGKQACGDIGIGRMAEPEAIYQIITDHNGKFSKLKVLITAGSTKEKIDPVRYISNYSSGKMGYALAKAWQQGGAEVILISGSTQLIPPIGCQFVSVNTANDMQQAVQQYINSVDIFISSAAVSDYKPMHYSQHKIKKSAKSLLIYFTTTIDILQSIASSHSHLFKVGFCAETIDLIENAKKKQQKKQLNAIIANNISESGYPFNQDTNEVTYLNDKGDTCVFPKEKKGSLAIKLAACIFDDYLKFKNTRS